MFEWTEYRHCKETFCVKLISRTYTLIYQTSQRCNTLQHSDILAMCCIIIFVIICCFKSVSLRMSSLKAIPSAYLIWFDLIWCETAMIQITKTKTDNRKRYAMRNSYCFARVCPCVSQSVSQCVCVCLCVSVREKNWKVTDQKMIHFGDIWPWSLILRTKNDGRAQNYAPRWCSLI